MYPSINHSFSSVPSATPMYPSLTPPPNEPLLRLLIFYHPDVSLTCLHVGTTEVVVKKPSRALFFPGPIDVCNYPAIH